MIHGVHPEDIGGFIYNPESLKRIYDDLIQEAGGEFLFNTSLIDVLLEDGNITAAVCAAKSGIFGVVADIYIDATGDGDLAAMAGAPFEMGDENGLVQVGTLAQGLAESGCRFCTACVEVCPTGAILDHKLPSGDKRKALVPCRSACPAQIGSLILGADNTSSSRMIAKGRFTFSVVKTQKREPPCGSN